jgi:hypothetical protein
MKRKKREKRRQLEAQNDELILCPEVRCHVLKEECPKCESYDKDCPYTAFARAENEQLRVSMSLPPDKRPAKTIITEYWAKVQETRHRLI